MNNMFQATATDLMLQQVISIQKARDAERQKFTKFSCEASSVYEKRRDTELRTKYSMENGLILECGVTSQDCIDQQQPKQPAQPATPKKGDSVTFKVSNASQTRRVLELEIKY
jgi:hypothetical protein